MGSLLAVNHFSFTARVVYAHSARVSSIFSCHRIVLAPDGKNSGIANRFWRDLHGRNQHCRPARTGRARRPRPDRDRPAARGHRAHPPGGKNARAHGARRHARDAERPVAARQPELCLRRGGRCRGRSAARARARIRRADRAGRMLRGAAARVWGGADGQGGGGVSGGVSGRAAARDGGACPARAGAAGGRGVRAGGELCRGQRGRARTLHVAARARHGSVGHALRAVRPRGAHPRARPGGRLPRDGRGHARPLPADRGTAGAADGPDGDRDRRGRARARAAQRGRAAARGLVFAARGARRAGTSPRRRVVHRGRRGGDAVFVAAAGLCDKERVGRGAAADPGVGGSQGPARCGIAARDEAALRAAAGAAPGHPAGGADAVRHRGAADLPGRRARALRAAGGILPLQPRRARAAHVRPAGRPAGGGHGARAHRPRHPARGARGDRRAQRALGQPVLSLHAPSRTDPRREMERVGAQARRITGAGAAGARPAGHAAVRRRGRGRPERHGVPADARRRHAPDARRGARARGRDAPPAQPRRGGCAARRGHARLRPAAPAHGHRAAERERHGLGARVRRAGRRRPLRRRVRRIIYGLL